MATSLQDKASALAADLEKIMTLDEPSAEDVTKATQLNDELKGLETQIEQTKALMRDVDARKSREKEEKNAVTRPNGWNAAGAPQSEAMTYKSLGDLYVESKEYKARAGRFNEQDSFSTELVYKTLIMSTGLVQPVPQPQLFQPLPQLPLSLLDLIPSVTVTNGAISYIQETAFTNAAAPVSEGSPKPESGKTFINVIAPVTKIAHWIPVTTECLADAPFIRSVIDTNLKYGVRTKIQQQVLAGSGVPPELKGINTYTNIQNIAFATDIPTSIMAGISAIEAVGGVPTGIVMSAADWSTVRLTVGGTPYVYLWGPPTERGVMEYVGSACRDRAGSAVWLRLRRRLEHVPPARAGRHQRLHWSEERRPHQEHFDGRLRSAHRLRDLHASVHCEGRHGCMIRLTKSFRS